MGFLDKFKKKDETASKQMSQDSGKQQERSEPQTAGKKIKKYNSEGKPLE